MVAGNRMNKRQEAIGRTVAPYPCDRISRGGLLPAPAPAAAVVAYCFVRGRGGQVGCLESLAGQDEHPAKTVAARLAEKNLRIAGVRHLVRAPICCVVSILFHAGKLDSAAVGDESVTWIERRFLQLGQIVGSAVDASRYRRARRRLATP
jgi:hypothetical protein